MSEGAVTVNAETCTGCAACLDSCPVDVFRLDPATGKAVAVYARDCHVCYLCDEDCPTGSIHLDHNASNARRFSMYDLMGIPI